MTTLAHTQTMMLVDRSDSGALWDMSFEDIRNSMEVCIANLEKLIPENQAALAELYSEAVVADQNRYDSLYGEMPLEDVDSENENKGFYLDGDGPIRTSMIAALQERGDRGGYELLLQSYEPLLPAAKDFAARLEAVRETKDWRNALVDRDTGLNDAAARLMGRLMTAKATQSAFTGFYIANVRASEQ